MRLSIIVFSPLCCAFITATFYVLLEVDQCVLSFGFSVQLLVLAKWSAKKTLWGTAARGSSPQSPGRRAFMIFLVQYSPVSLVPDPEMLSRPGSPRPRPDRPRPRPRPERPRPRPRPGPQKVVLIGLETKTRSRDMYAMLSYKSSKS